MDNKPGSSTQGILRGTKQCGTRQPHNVYADARTQYATNCKETKLICPLQQSTAHQF